MSYKITTTKSFEEVVNSFEDIAKEKGFGVLKVYNFTEILKEKGFPIKNEIAVFEICNPKYAHQVLEKEPSVSMFLPCKISVMNIDGETELSMLKPAEVLVLLKAESVKEIFEEVDVLLKEILNEFK